ncbi:putative ribonuclease H-like domain-containing protein, partial [Tanacetum coccineum]
MNYDPVTAGNQTNGDAVHQSTDDKDADEVPDKGDDDVSQRNGQEKEGGASNKEDDKHVQDFRAELDSLLVQQKEGYANNTNKDSIASPSVSTAGPNNNTANENLNIGSPNINTASSIPNNSSMQSLENTSIFDDAYDDREVGARWIDLKQLGNQPWKHKRNKSQRLSKLPIFLFSLTNRTQEGDSSFDRSKLDRSNARGASANFKLLKELDSGWIFLKFPDKVYKVEKALYGLHQAPRAWYNTLYTCLLENGYRRGTIDKTLFIKKDRGDILLVQVYVDDIIFGSIKKSLCVEFEQMMHKRFQMSSIGDLTLFLGLQVMQKDDGIFISQDKYVADILKKFDFFMVNTASTPIETNKALLKDEEAEDVDVHLYRSMIGSLMYLTAFRPDIIFAVCACARFQVTPKVSHLHDVKRIFRYLKGQPKLGLWYPMDSPFNLEAFSDNKTVYKEWKDIMERDATTASSLKAEQDSGSGPKCQDPILGGAKAQI